MSCVAASSGAAYVLSSKRPPQSPSRFDVSSRAQSMGFLVGRHETFPARLPAVGGRGVQRCEGVDERTCRGRCPFGLFVSVGFARPLEERSEGRIVVGCGGDALRAEIAVEPCLFRLLPVLVLDGDVHGEVDDLVIVVGRIVVAVLYADHGHFAPGGFISAVGGRDADGRFAVRYGNQHSVVVDSGDERIVGGPLELFVRGVLRQDRRGEPEGSDTRIGREVECLGRGVERQAFDGNAVVHVVDRETDRVVDVHVVGFGRERHFAESQRRDQTALVDGGHVGIGAVPSDSPVGGVRRFDRDRKLVRLAGVEVQFPNVDAYFLDMDECLLVVFAAGVDGSDGGDQKSVKKFFHILGFVCWLHAADKSPDPVSKIIRMNIFWPPCREIN